MGMKGAGEAGAIGAPPAVVNAIVDAICPHTGVKHVDMPVTAASLWQVIEANRGRRAA
jgi:carbon-monoxide dehydrogenase large subunit